MKILCEEGRLSYDTLTGDICWEVCNSNRVKVGVPIMQAKSNKNYVQVRLDGKLKLGHRIAWEAVNGTIPEGMTINHMNGNKADNRLSNLEMLTLKENIQHAKRTGLTPHCLREEHPVVGVSLKDGSGWFFKSSVVAKAFGFRNVTTLCKHPQGSRKQDKGYTWSYHEEVMQCAY